MGQARARLRGGGQALLRGALLAGCHSLGSTRAGRRLAWWLAFAVPAARILVSLGQLPTIETHGRY